ncbi:hypothetical protein CY34DRAFT_16003 [Suillus luteus UH-Slu-Lm8-n1]|uniref:Peptidase M24 domain-containing protein n=1 Tax=Suillus luteus UH-Slu-Lm8-n1 TaxID=930992 RepID=A0A0D0AFV1_9AGAM|nr:hypothetical protein CY34DRAFT_16003 [Suillus luteus UH-Slu-Lm8-n1]
MDMKDPLQLEREILMILPSPKITILTTTKCTLKSNYDSAAAFARSLECIHTADYIVNDVMNLKLIELCVKGTKIVDLCIEGDKFFEEETGGVYKKAVKGVKMSKGLAFPTSISVNNTVAHFSPLASDSLSSQFLAKGDVVKVHISAHIDDFTAISAETIVVGAFEKECVTGRKADVIKAAWHAAAELAMRLVKVITDHDAVATTAAAWNCKPVEDSGMLSCQQSNIIDAKKHIIFNPNETQKRNSHPHPFDPFDRLDTQM